MARVERTRIIHLDFNPRHIDTTRRIVADILGRSGHNPSNRDPERVGHRVVHQHRTRDDLRFALPERILENQRERNIIMNDNNSGSGATTYIRSINDYTMSGHEIHSQLFGASPISSGILNVSQCPYTQLAPVQKRVDEYMLSHGYISRKNANVVFVPDEDGELDEYTTYAQTISAYASRDSNYDQNYVTIEYVGSASVIALTVMSSQDVTPIVDFIASIRGEYKVKKPERNDNTFFTISATGGGFRLEEMTIAVPHFDSIIDTNYNDDFRDADLVVQEAIIKNKKGLMLLHGAPGTGKTSYIRHLISGKCERKIVYIPPHLSVSIASPTFISFIKNHLSNSVIVIEDAEQVLMSRENDSTHKEAVSNILNLTDGILADALNILIVCTFNTDTKNLDTALLRKGRLLLNYKFENLNLEKTNALTQKLYGKTVPKPLPLSEIYNLEYDLIVPKEVEKVAFGFNKE